MADTKISLLSAGTTLAGTEAIPMVQSAATVKTTPAALKTFCSASPTLVTPALGTPASGTLTNCTGLPVAGVVASTSTALGVGSVELGHASDTTIARSSAGVVTIESVPIVTTTATQTLTNKTLTSPAISDPTITGTVPAATVTTLTVTNPVDFKNANIAHSTLTYGASVAVDFTGDGLKTVTLTGNITFTTSNLAAGRSVTVRIIGDGSSRTLTFPGTWTFIGAAAPASLAASKTAVLTLTSFSTTDANVVAAYSAQP